MKYEKRVLFTAEETGSRNCRLPCIIPTPQGTLLAFCEARQGGGGDWDLADIFVKRSDDGGATWGDAHRLVGRHAYGEGNAGNVVAMVDRETGKTHLLFCFRYERFFTLETADGGRTFSTPREITSDFNALRARYPWKVLAFGPGHGIQLKRGRLIVGAWASAGEGHEQGANLGHRPSQCFAVFSDDHGKTWQTGAAAAVTGEDVLNPSECIPAELPDGAVLLNIRTESNARRRRWARSMDEGRTWESTWFDATLPEPICASSMLSLGDDCSLMIYVGLDSRPDHSKRAESWREAWDANMAPRKSLALWLSRDQGANWAGPQILEAGKAAYVDACISPDGRSVHILYEHGNDLNLISIPTRELN